VRGIRVTLQNAVPKSDVLEFFLTRILKWGREVYTANARICVNPRYLVRA